MFISRLEIKQPSQGVALPLLHAHFLRQLPGQLSHGYLSTED